MDNIKIHVFEATFRDSEQVPGGQLNKEEK